jgi:hypothetical protein
MLKRIYLVLWLLPLCMAQLAGSAHAQTNPELGDSSANTVLPPAPAPASTTTSATSTVATSGTDHAAMIHHFGVGTFGVLQLPVASCYGGMLNPNNNPSIDTVVPGGCVPTEQGAGANLSAPTIGARYWLDERMAIEAAIGLGYSSGNRKVENGPTMTTNAPSLFGLALHGGLPLVFATSTHFAFEVVPELDLGFVTGGWDDTRTANADATLSGFLLQLGARVGAEIHFGFMGIPQLALQGSVGLHMRYEGRSASIGNTNTSSHHFGFGTTVQGSPWDIFRENISAIYYF